MTRVKVVMSVAGCALVAAGLLIGQAGKKAKKGGGSAAGVLHPEMTVAADAGSYEKPAGTMGEKGAEWTETTVNAGVDKKPLAGKATTVAGEIIDLSCYLQLGKHGDKHKACGTKCLQSGQPIGLLAKDGTVYMLMAEEHDPRRDGQTEGFRKAAVDNFAKILEVTGTETSVRGYRAIYVQGYVNK